MQASEPVQIVLPDENITLEGCLDGPERAPGLVLCHPHPAFGGTMDTPIVEALAEGFADAGLRVLRFNFRGVRSSGGKGEGGLVEHRDVQAACAFLRARAATDLPLALCGYSFGALMAAKTVYLGEPIRAYGALGFPTTIIEDHADRIEQVSRSLRAVPSILVAGSNDQFCDLDHLRAWSRGAPSVSVVELPGVGHFPTGPDLDAAVRPLVEFLRP